MLYYFSTTSNSATKIIKNSVSDETTGMIVNAQVEPIVQKVKGTEEQCVSNEVLVRENHQGNLKTFEQKINIYHCSCFDGKCYSGELTMRQARGAGCKRPMFARTIKIMLPKRQLR